MSVRPKVTNKMLAYKQAQLFTVRLQYSCAKRYLVCMVWPDPLSCRAFIVYSILAPAPGVISILASADT